MMAHDVVPHSETHHDINDKHEVDSITAISEHHSHSDIGHIFEHFEHNSNDKNLTHLETQKVNKSRTDIKFSDFLFIINNNQELWYANLEKQRFRDHFITPYYFSLSSHRLRGPPSFC